MPLPSLLLSLLLVAQQDTARDAPRRPSGIAPSLPALTLQEEDKLDEIIDRFIDADTGKLKGAEGRKAAKEFEALGREAIPALIRGLNKAAALEHSCPTLVITKKLMRMLLSSNDIELLDYARENIGAGVNRSRHGATLTDLRVQCMLRKSALVRLAGPGPKPLTNLSTAELTRAVSTDKGPRLKQVLNELETRRDPEVLTTLAGVAGSSDGDLRTFALQLVDRHLARESPEVLRQKLADEDAEMRKAAIRVAIRKSALVKDVIERLDDSQSDVREEAHAALVKLARGQDLGPRADAEAGDRRQAQERWRTWWQRQKR